MKIVGSGWSGDGGAAEARAAVGLDNPAPRLQRPQLVWTPQLHKRFFDAVAHLGIKNAVPRTILQLMSVDGLTRENVASHLTKYRLYLKRLQVISGNWRGDVGVDNVSVDPTNHLMATLPAPGHFSNPRWPYSNHILPFMPVAAMQQQQHHRMTTVVGPRVELELGLGPGPEPEPSHYPQLQQQFRNFGSLPPNEHQFMRQSHQQVQSVGVPVHSSTGSVVSPLSVEDSELPGRGVLITLFPPRDASS
ncbi:transcription activator GLK2-like [Olea europaea var. sylvestris]|uniref:transcription activator GLK2-like n=1 Tax=Olea europaea var. sylvestris TaxID=158386 RepID=UPI000C1CF26E|nr:transcription activator GLK2-like [Olea europaea var. sylvestris]XP_022882833.1 transcription activator GLK2-like [Olea europaea var. sylvestris]XP_022882834.1 transcription activator GLK2-like [Olea europaea var. sylvestris]